jgi:hypothetical protein
MKRIPKIKKLEQNIVKIKKYEQMLLNELNKRKEKQAGDELRLAGARIGLGGLLQRGAKVIIRSAELAGAAVAPGWIGMELLALELKLSSVLAVIVVALRRLSAG